MAEVWLAQFTSVGGFAKNVVLKTIHPQLAESPEFVEMFIKEASVTAHLNHPNVVQIFELGEIESRYFIAMEHIAGRSLRQIGVRLRRASPDPGAPETSKPVPVWFLLNVIARACDGLHYVHDFCDEEGRPLGLVHRDMSPENVMVSFAGAVKVLDFGVVTNLEESDATQKSGRIVGKLSYMPPEQARREPIDRRADIYSVGVMLYEYLTGKRPFRGKDEVAILRQVMSGTFPHPQEVVPGIPDELARIVMTAMAPDPADRYPTARKLRADILEYLQPNALFCDQNSLSLFVSALFPDSPDIPANVKKALLEEDDLIRSIVTPLAGQGPPRSAELAAMAAPAPPSGEHHLSPASGVRVQKEAQAAAPKAAAAQVPAPAQPRPAPPPPQAPSRGGTAAATPSPAPKPTPRGGGPAPKVAAPAAASAAPASRAAGIATPTPSPAPAARTPIAPAPAPPRSSPAPAPTRSPAAPAAAPPPRAPAPAPTRAPQVAAPAVPVPLHLDLHVESLAVAAPAAPAPAAPAPATSAAPSPAAPATAAALEAAQPKRPPQQGQPPTPGAPARQTDAATTPIPAASDIIARIAASAAASTVIAPKATFEVAARREPAGNRPPAPAPAKAPETITGSAPGEGADLFSSRRSGSETAKADVFTALGKERTSTPAPGAVSAFVARTPPEPDAPRPPGSSRAAIEPPAIPAFDKPGPFRDPAPSRPPSNPGGFGDFAATPIHDEFTPARASSRSGAFGDVGSGTSRDDAASARTPSWSGAFGDYGQGSKRDEPPQGRTSNSAGWGPFQQLDTRPPPRAVAATHFEVGLALVRERRYEDALLEWEKALSLDPSNRAYQTNIQRLKERLSRKSGRDP